MLSLPDIIYNQQAGLVVHQSPQVSRCTAFSSWMKSVIAKGLYPLMQARKNLGAKMHTWTNTFFHPDYTVGSRFALDPPP